MAIDLPTEYSPAPLRAGFFSAAGNASSSCPHTHDPRHSDDAGSAARAAMALRAKLRLKIKTLLKRYKYPPDQQASAVETVLLQAETLGEDLVVEAA